MTLMTQRGGWNKECSSQLRYDLIPNTDDDFEFGRSSTFLSHDDYHLFQDLETCSVLETWGIRAAQREAIGSSFPIMWLHQICYHSLGNELIQ